MKTVLLDVIYGVRTGVIYASVWMPDSRWLQWVASALTSRGDAK